MLIIKLKCREMIIHTFDPVIDPLRDHIEIIKRSPDRCRPRPDYARALLPLTVMGKILTVVWLF